MSHVTIRPGEAGATPVAQGLLAAAAALGLPADVVEWSPSLGGFKVPEVVAAAYAGSEDPDATPDPEETGQAGDDGGEAPAGDGGPPPAETEAAGPRRYNEQEKAAAVAAVKGGRTIASVAEEMGASATTVSKWVSAAAAKEEEVA